MFEVLSSGFEQFRVQTVQRSEFRVSSSVRTVQRSEFRVQSLKLQELGTRNGLGTLNWEPGTGHPENPELGTWNGFGTGNPEPETVETTSFYQLSGK